ncbi:MAG: DUF2071 domain-containing protein [Verrucomicrobiota bacterium]
MTILHDLYRNPNAKRRGVGRSGRKVIQQGRGDDSTLLTGRGPRRPDSEEARATMESGTLETAFLADWVEMNFLHFEVDPDLLQENVPFPLDLHEGKAYVSLVAFTMKRLRPALGGAATEWTTRPIASHQFLNLRTYVNDGERTGIFFMKEWLNNRLAVTLGPKTFGLPYRWATLRYPQDPETCRGEVVAEEGALRYRGSKDPDLKAAAPGSLTEFLLERYTAFTSAGKQPKFFRVWHRPWKAAELKGFALEERSLLDHLKERWTETARFVGAHWSPGVFDVWMGRPHAVR